MSRSVPTRAPHSFPTRRSSDLPDVLPVDDFGVREGYRLAYGCRERPTPQALRAIGERWKPYRSAAAWYLWRAAGAPRKKDRKSTRLNSSHLGISYAVFCLKKKT